MALSISLIETEKIKASAETVVQVFGIKPARSLAEYTEFRIERNIQSLPAYQHEPLKVA